MPMHISGAPNTARLVRMSAPLTGMPYIAGVPSSIICASAIPESISAFPTAIAPASVTGPVSPVITPDVKENG